MTEVAGQPIYQQIADSIRAQIQSGELSLDDPLPSTQKLMAIYGASNNVVRNAVALLKQEGLVVGQPGKAVTVRAKPAQARRERATLKSLTDDLAKLQDKFDRLTEQLPADLIARIEELSADVAELQANLRTLYDRSAMKYPHSTKTPETRRRKSSGA